MNAIRLDTRHASLPKATETLLNDSAEAIYTTMREFWDETSALGGPRNSRPDILPWDRLDVEQRLRWVNAAKEGYCVIALAGGARRIERAAILPESDADH